MSTVQALTEEDRQFLFEQKNSEHYRVFRRALEHLYLIECSKLVSAKQDDLTRHQGILQGLSIAKSLLYLGEQKA